MTKQEQKIEVGSLVTAKSNTGACREGESGVCYEVYRLENRPGYGFIFERGKHYGFSPEDVNRFLEVSGRVSPHVADYRFESVGRLYADYLTGRFSAAFEERNIERAQEQSAWPHPRDILRREHDENARREAAGIEPKRTDFDLDK